MVLRLHRLILFSIEHARSRLRPGLRANGTLSNRPLEEQRAPGETDASGRLSSAPPHQQIETEASPSLVAMRLNGRGEKAPHGEPG